MTERKPADMTIESWVDRQIRIAVERGDLDGLPGAGRPIPPSPADDELGWVRRKLEAEGLPTDALLPMSLQLRREIDRLPAALAHLDARAPGAEAEVRAMVSDLNRRIAAWLRAPSPPLLPVAPVDADAAVARWRAGSAARAAPPAHPTPAAGAPPTPGSRTHDMAADSPARNDATGRNANAGDAPAHDDAGVTVYWRPGCVFCQRLRLVLWARRLHPRMVNIWEDAEAAAFVRSVADGNETVPTVVIDGTAHVNPAPSLVVAALRR